MGDLPHRVKPDPDGRYTVDVHVTPDGKARIGNREYTPEEFAEILRRNGDYDGRPIRLIGCDASSNGFAERLSRELDTEVMAPNKRAWTDSNGNVFSSDHEIGPDGKPRPKIPPNGEWSTHSPDGSTSRTGDDGFTPDTPDGNKRDVDVDSSHSRGDGPDGDPDSTPSRDRTDEPDWRRQERELSDKDLLTERRRNPAGGEFNPPSHPGKTADVGGPNGDGKVRPPRRDERFPTDQELDANTAYKVYDEDGRLRGTYHTDDNGKVTHIETTHPNEPPRRFNSDTRQWEDNPGYHPNFDVATPHPNVTYRVEIDGNHQVFHTDGDGIPRASVEFHRPPCNKTETIGWDDPKAPPSSRSFARGGPYEPYTRYEVHDRAGVHRGTFYTGGDGHVRWAEVESGVTARTNPDFRGIKKYWEFEQDGRRAFANDAKVELRTEFDPKSRAPQGHDPAKFKDATEEPVTLKPGQSFLDNVKPPLEANKKYVVSSDYSDGSVKKKDVDGDADGDASQSEKQYVRRVRSVYWTNDKGEIEVVETFRPFHADLNDPRPGLVCRVDDNFVYQTGPAVLPGKGIVDLDQLNTTELRKVQTDTVIGHSGTLAPHKVSEDLSAARWRESDGPGESTGEQNHRDETAQKQSNRQGDGTGPYDGGHLVGHQFDGPGELMNMMAQWRLQNQNYLPDNWYKMEDELAAFLDKPGTSIKNFEVFPLREDGMRAPHKIQVRWVEVDANGNHTVHVRSFPNEPPTAGSTATSGGDSGD
jgi:hypothetical protein